MDTQHPDYSNLWVEYLKSKQTYAQLAEQYGVSKRTIQRQIDKVKVADRSIAPPRRVILLMDTTYWGRGFGLMLFKDWVSKQNLLWYFVRAETNSLYAQGYNELAKQGFEIAAVVCDGRKGLLESFGDTPVQMCQFHQRQIIRRYLTNKPKTAPAMELKALVGLLTKTDKESFVGGLGLWHAKWKAFLDERSIHPQTKKSRYTHRRLRSAYFSLMRNMPHLFTWYDRIELGIPNTTNAIDGHFADLKNKLRNHNGLTKDRKVKFINGFLKASGSQSME